MAGATVPAYAGNGQGSSPVSPIGASDIHTDSLLASYKLDNLRFHIVSRWNGTYVDVSKFGGNTPVSSLRLPFFYGTTAHIRRGASGKFILFVQSSSSTDGVVILDPAGLTIEDAYMCFQPSVSPDGRYIAFTRLYPPRSPAPEDRSAFAVLYDVLDDKALNRHQRGAEVLDGDVGMLAYPTKLSTGPMGHEHWQGPIHVHNSGYAWAPDSKSFAFIDTVETLGGALNAGSAGSGTIYAVIVKLADQAWTASRAKIQQTHTNGPED
jgi:hypothetical protein